MARASHPDWLELGLLLGLGAGNVAVELFGLPKTPLVVGGVALWAIYLAAQVRRKPDVLRRWGLRADTLKPAAREAAAITLPLAGIMVAYGFARGHLPPPPGFWLILALYPAWGLAQNFLLNAMLARNLRTVMSESPAVALATLLFSLSHAPDLEIMALTLFVAPIWLVLYRRHPNLWVLGVAHGLLGTLAFFALLGRDVLGALVG
jgi:membrane protease YdiL (CAAX protease family)